SVQDRIQADDAGKWDVSPARKEITLRGGRLCLPPSYEDDCPAALTLAPWAMSQFCQRLGIPTPYFKRCPPDLKDLQANHWLRFAPATDDCDHDRGGEREPDPAAKDETWLLRGRRDRLRGVLSSRYARLDNATLLSALRPLLQSRENRLEVKDFSLSEESLHLRLVDPSISREVLKDDRLFVGFHVSNSEVGVRSVRVDALVWRLVCSNGLIRLVNGRSLFHRRHVSFDPDGFSRSLQTAIAEAVMEGAGLLERLALAAQVPVPDVPAAIRSLSEQWRLSERTQEMVTASLLSETPSQQETVYGLVNAFTSAAHHLDSEERYRIETLAARLAETGVPTPRRIHAMPPLSENAIARNGFAAPGLSRNGRSRAGALVGV
ncbi:MAG: DUF945 domain-containing protein, partial [Armatimonadota bacterium]|nr:DUF945 domain-containing protein [Armatimonadota bacterium]